jgi:hypothetical protein
MKFDYTLDFERTDLRAHPELYRVGRGEQGVLLVEPYKSELLPHWRFRTPEVARESAAKLRELYEAYKRAGDFVGMDMARKYIQMGWTRSMRYANHRSGKKYVGPVPADRKGRSGAHGRRVAPPAPDEVKLESARVFKGLLDAVLSDPAYLAMREAHRRRYEATPDAPEATPSGRRKRRS